MIGLIRIEHSRLLGQEALRCPRAPGWRLISIQASKRASMAVRQIATPMFLAIAGILSGCAASETADRSADVAKIEARRDYFRIVGEAEFDGERISYNEIIQVRTDIGVISTMGLVKGDNRIYMSRLWVTRLLKDGSALIMEVPEAWGLFGDLERTDGQMDPSWTPAHIRDYMRPPPEILPEFYWADRAINPTSVEAYVSEAYYAQPRARLKVLAPFKIEFVPSSPDAEATAIAQKNSEPPLPLGEDGRVGWAAPLALAIEKADWSKLDEVTRAVQDNSGTDFAFTDPILRILVDYASTKLRWRLNPTSFAYGVPQPMRFPDGEGILYRKASGRHADSTIPIRCDPNFNRCALSLNERSFVVFYRHKLSTLNFSMSVGSVTRSGQAGRAIYKHDNETIYLITVTSM
jgi:hypothetical protein